MFSVRRRGLTLVLGAMFALARSAAAAEEFELLDLPQEVRDLAADMIRIVVEDVPQDEIRPMLKKHFPTIRGIVLENKYPQLKSSETGNELMQKVLAEQWNEMLKARRGMDLSPVWARLREWRPKSFREAAVESLRIAQGVFDQGLLQLVRTSHEANSAFAKQQRAILRSLPPPQRKWLIEGTRKAAAQGKNFAAWVKPALLKHALANEDRYIDAVERIARLKGVQGSFEFLRGASRSSLNHLKISETPEFIKIIDAFELPEGHTKRMALGMARAMLDDMTAEEKAKLLIDAVKLPVDAPFETQVEKIAVRLPKSFIKGIQSVLDAQNSDPTPKSEFVQKILTALERVQSDLPPHLNPDQVRSVLHETFNGQDGAPRFDDVFESVELVPKGVGSVAQTHVARLKDGSTVAVKIQAPGLREEFMKDMARALSAVDADLQAPLKSLFDSFVDETSFWREARNLVMGYMAHHSPEEGIIVPKLHTRFNPTEKILVMEYIAGESFNEKNKTPAGKAWVKKQRPRLLKHQLQAGLVRAEPIKVSDRDAYLRWAANKFGPKEFAQMKLEAQSLVHGDPHSGNIIDTGRVNAKGKPILAFIDYGNVTSLKVSKEGIDERTAQIKLLSAAHAVHDPERPARLPLQVEKALTYLEDAPTFGKQRQLSFADPGTRGRFLRDLGEMFADAKLGPEERYASTLKIAARHGVELPKSLLQFNKAMFVLTAPMDALDREAVFKDIAIEQVLRVPFGKSALDDEDWQNAGQIVVKKIFGEYPYEAKAKESGKQLPARVRSKETSPLNCLVRLLKGGA